MGHVVPMAVWGGAVTAERGLPRGLGVQERAVLHTRLSLSVRWALGCRNG